MRNHKLRVAIALVALLAIACACDRSEKEKKEPLPSEAFAAYLAAWQQLDFAGMYDLLTPEAQAAATKEAFVQRYRQIYDGIEASSVAVAAVPEPDTATASAERPANGTKNEGDNEATLRYEVRMDTVAGPIQFEHEAKLIKGLATDGEKSSPARWRIAWEPSLLFPQMADGDKVRVRTSRGERGEILDRNGNGLAVNGTALQVGIVPGKLEGDGTAAKAKLAAELQIGIADIDGKLAAKWVKPDLFVPIALIGDQDADRFAGIPGVAVQSKKLRVYPYAEAAAHLTGYVGEVSAEQLNRLKDQGYEAGDLIGKAGLEQVYENRLRGTLGARIAITDANGKEKAVLAERQAVPGETIKLGIDAELQRTMYEELKQDASAASAIDPRTGDILALVSTPAYDPNAFARGLTQERYAAWNDDPQKPFLNRFTKNYAPGSSFKVVTAAMGLDAGTLDPAEKVSIKGLKWTKDASWGSYYVKRVHDVDPVDLASALIYSDNVYFAQAALKLGADAFAADAAKFGVGEAIPVDYPFMKAQLANNGIRGDIQLADSGYGQGEVSMTTLQVALMFSSLANEGSIVYPTLETHANAGHPQYWKENAMKPETAKLLTEDLIQAVSQPGAVGHGAYLPGRSIAGKTGTAEIKMTKGGDGTENGWFVGFDAADPKLLLAVMVEDVKGRGGSGYVTPKVKRIFQKSSVDKMS